MRNREWMLAWCVVLFFLFSTLNPALTAASVLKSVEIYWKSRGRWWEIKDKNVLIQSESHSGPDDSFITPVPATHSLFITLQQHKSCQLVNIFDTWWMQFWLFFCKGVLSFVADNENKAYRRKFSNKCIAHKCSRKELLYSQTAKSCIQPEDGVLKPQEIERCVLALKLIWQVLQL